MTKEDIEKVGAEGNESFQEENESLKNKQHNPDIAKILQSLPEDKRSVIVTAIRQSNFSGPVPPPEILQGYKLIIPDAPQRILKMAEDQTKHRHEMEKMIVKSQTRQSALGQILGFILVLFFGVATLYLGIKGHDWLAGVIASTTIIGLAIVFVLNKKPSYSQENMKKEKSI